jgi:2-oxoglutarate ferredoxin oxidoreductase subunit alpha
VRAESEEKEILDPASARDGRKSASPPSAQFLLGNVAAAEGALAAGCTFYAGYPITPSSELMHHMAVHLRRRGGVFVQMEDEIASISAIVGASWTGVKSMTATSGPGLSLMMEGIGYAAMTETPCVLVDIQRAGPCTGQATHVGAGDVMQIRHGSHGDYMPVAVAPWSVQEMFDLTVRAFNLAERFRVPAFVMADEAVGHLRESAVIRTEVETITRPRPHDDVAAAAPFGTDAMDGIPPMPFFGEGANLLVTGSTHDERGYRKVDHPQIQQTLVQRLTQKITRRRAEIVDLEHYFCEDAQVVVLAYGFTARSALAAVKQCRQSHKKVGLCRLKTLWPFADREIADLSQGLKGIVFPEMNLGQLAGVTRQHAHCAVESLSQTNGRIIEPAVIQEAIERFF